MAIFDSFYLLFKADTSDLKKGATEVENVVKKTDRSFSKLSRSISSFVAATGATYKILQGITSATEYANELGVVSQQLKINISDLDMWGNAVRRVGGTSEGFQQSLKNLSEHLNTSGSNALKSLPKLADTFSKLNNTQAQKYGKSLGLDESTISLLQKGQREVDGIIRRQKELGVVTEKDREIAQKFKLANVELEISFRNLYLAIGQSVLPILTDFYNLIVPTISYITDHKDLAVGAFLAIGASVALMLAPLIRAHAALLVLTSAFALIYEDIQAFRKGNASLIGDILNRWPTVGKVVEGILLIWKAGFTIIRDLFREISNFIGGNKDISVDIKSAQRLISDADKNPIGSQSSTIFNAQSLARSSNISVGDVTINTQATDSEGISQDFKKQLLDKHLWQANNDFADGVAY